MSSSSKQFLQVPPQFKRSYCPGTSNSLFNNDDTQFNNQKYQSPLTRQRHLQKNSLVSQSMIPMQGRKKIPSFLKKGDKNGKEEESVLESMAHMVHSEPIINIIPRQKQRAHRQQARTPNRQELKKLNRQIYASQIHISNPQKIYSPHPSNHRNLGYEHNQINSDRKNEQQSYKKIFSRKGNLNSLFNEKKGIMKKDINQSQFLLGHHKHASESIEKQKEITLDSLSSQSYSHIPQFLKKEKKKQQCGPISPNNNQNKDYIKEHIKGNSIFKKKKMIKSLGIDDEDSFEQKKSVESKKPIQIDDFELVEKIGKGAYGDVFLAKQKNIGFICVIKKISKKKIREKNLYESILREITIQAYINHRHLTPLYGVFDDLQYVYLILELLHDDTLAYQIKKCKHMPQQRASGYVRQLCQALSYMHNENIIHRDVKPDNVFIHENYLKLGDMGCSVQTDTLRKTVVGCLAYVSPQQLAKGFYDQKIDVWSLGTLTYELLFGKAPFQKQLLEMATQQMEMKVLPDLIFPVQYPISAQAHDFIEKLLRKDPQQRICIKTALKHPFITKGIEIQKKKLRDNAQLISAINQMLQN